MMQKRTVNRKSLPVMRSAVLSSLTNLHIPKKLQDQIIISKTKDGKIVINNKKIDASY